jgi:hypothetical protein
MKRNFCNNQQVFCIFNRSSQFFWKHRLHLPSLRGLSKNGNYFHRWKSVFLFLSLLLFSIVKALRENIFFPSNWNNKTFPLATSVESIKKKLWKNAFLFRCCDTFKEIVAMLSWCEWKLLLFLYMMESALFWFHKKCCTYSQIAFI